MKSLFLFLIPTLFFSFIPVKSNPPDPNKTYAVTMHKTVAEWQVIISALANSEFISSASSTRTQNEILLQVNQQLAQEAEQQKKQDSLKAKPQGPNKPKSDIQDTNKPNTKDKGK